MNYFAHGRRFLDDPYFVAGTALPDWLNVVNRKSRVRSRHAQPYLKHDDPRAVSFARGVIQHHHDDGWFHQTRAFAELSLSFAVEIRDRLPADPGFRPSFLGHILVELLLDSVLVDEDPSRLDRYYEAVMSVDPAQISAWVDTIATCPAPGLDLFIPRFCDERFLSDYGDDEKLLYRLNRVLERVGLQVLPSTIKPLFAKARRDVQCRRDELLAGET